MNNSAISTVTYISYWLLCGPAIFMMLFNFVSKKYNISAVWYFVAMLLAFLCGIVGHAVDAHAATYHYEDQGGYAHLNLYGAYTSGWQSASALTVAANDDGPVTISASGDWSDWSGNAPLPYQHISLELTMQLFWDFDEGSREGFDEETGQFHSNNGASYVFTADNETFSGFSGFEQDDDYFQLSFRTPDSRVFELYIAPELLFLGPVSAQRLVSNPEPMTWMLLLAGMLFLAFFRNQITGAHYG